MEMPRVIAIYSRKSRFTGQGESVGNQVELCRTYLSGVFGGEEAGRAVVFEDEGFSGGNLNRPGFQRMMEAVRGGRIRAVVVYRLDRISRSISDFSALIQELGRLGVDFLSLREHFDTSSPMGRAMMYIASVFSQLERETIAERIRDNMHQLAKTGRWLGGITPTGYTSEAVQTVTVDGKRKRVCRLRPVPGEAEVVRRIFALYRENGSLTETEAELLRLGVQTKTGRTYTRFSIKGILQNPVYLTADQAARRYFADRGAEVWAGEADFDGVRGMLAYNRTAQEKGKTTVSLPVCQWIVSVGEHPGLIPSDVWIGVQELLERSRSRAFRKPRSNQALLTGLLWCRCGGRMYPKLSRRGDGTPVHTYVCKTRERSKRSLCDCPNVGGTGLDAAVLEQVKGLAGDRDAFLARLEQLERGIEANWRQMDRQREDLRRQAEEKERKITALVDALADLEDSAAVGHVRTRMEELHGQAEDLRGRLAAWEGVCAPAPLPGAELDRLTGMLSEFRAGVDGMTVEQRRELLRTMVDRVVWDGQTAHVVLWGGGGDTPPGEDSK